MNQNRSVTLFLALLLAGLLLVSAAAAATTQVEIRKYANDNTTILNQTTVNYTWMMNNLPVLGDGTTHYYHQGPVFIDDPDPAVQAALRWNPEEDTNTGPNFSDKNMGAVKGTNLKDLCDLVGGMSPNEEVKIIASDGLPRWFAYKNVYEYSSRDGPIGICWYKDGLYPDTGYSDGMRLVWFADTSINPWGLHIFGNYDWKLAADEKYWYYYQSGGQSYPTTTGLSSKYVNRIYIYSNEAPPAPLDVIFEGTVTLADGTFTWTDDGGVGHSVSNLTPHGALEGAFLADGFTYGGSWRSDRNTALINWIDSGTTNYTYDGSVTPKLTWNYQKNGVYQNYFSATTGVSNNGVADGDFLEFYFGPDQQTTNNATAVLRITVNIEGSTVPPDAAFTSDTQSGPAPLTVQFTDQSSGTPPLTYAWDFTNDGTVDSTAQNATWTYTSAGTYTVNLTVTNSAGSDSELKTAYISVIEATVPLDALFISDTIPSTMIEGQSYEVSVTVQNIGTSTWYEADQFRLGGLNDFAGDAALFAYPRANLSPGASVVPGANAVFNFTMTAPAAGTYTPVYRMVWENHQWFGPTLSHPITVSAPPVIDILFDDTVTLTPSASFTKVAYNSGTSYPINWTTPLGALQATSLTYNVTDKNFAASGALLLDDVDVYLRKAPGYWYAYVNDAYKDGFNNPAGALNLIELTSGDRVEYYYADGVSNPVDLAEVLGKATAAVKTVADIPTGPVIPELYNGTVNLTPGASFTKVAYNSGTSYTVNWTTPLGALQATGLTYNVTDKRWSSDQVLLLDDVEAYIRNSPGNWFAYVNNVYKDGYGNHANGLNVIELADGDRVDFYYAAGVVDKNNLTETLSKATAAVKTVADTSGTAPPGDWSLSLSGAISETITRSAFEEGVACHPSHSANYTDGDGNVWGGMPLWLLVGWVDDENKHGTFNDALAAEGYSVKVTAGDGYSINFASADIARNNGYIVANTLNGEPLPELKPNSTKLCFPLQMIGPEVSSGQLVGNIASIELVGLPEPPEGWTLRMEGDVVDVISQQYFEEAIVCYHGITYTDGSGRTWGGVPLWDLVGSVDDIETTSHWTFNDTRANVTGYTVRVIAGDGFNATFNSLDISHNNGFIIANTLNGTPLTGSDANLKLVGPATTSGMQRVGNITTIRLEGLPAYPAGNWSLELIGAISDTIPQPEFDDAAACHPATYTDGSGNVYEGIPLWLLMGWVDDRVPHGPNGFNNALAQAGYTVIVTASDGYSKELSSQQIGTNSSFIVANRMNGSPLAGSKAPLQLVGSGLPSQSFSVGNIARIELTDFQEPTEIPTITIIKYAADGTTIINQTTVDHVWMEANLPVIGDGVTVYKYQGVTFDPTDLWDPTETKGMTPPKIANAIRGTRVSDICNLVGGMAPGTEVTFVATDGFTTTLPYDAIYPDPHVYSQLGDTVIAWYADGNYVPKYGDGPRLFFTPEDTVAGQWNMNQALPEQYWHYYYDSGSATNYPSVAGLSAKYVSTIRIYSAPLGDWVLALDGRDIGGLYQDISRSYFESALTCQFGAEHQAEYTDSSGRTWSGMPLWFLAGFVDDDDLHSNDAFNATLASAGYDIIVTASDGASTTIPSEAIIRNNNYIVANTLNGTRFADGDTNWPLRLVGQNVSGAMSVKKIASIDLVPRAVSGDPELRIVPLQANLTIGATGTYQVLLTSAPEGLAGFNLSVTLAEPAVGEIVSKTLPGWASMNRSSTLPADTVWIEAVDLGKSVQAGATNILLCEVTIRGDQPGISAIQVQPIQIDADGGGIIALDPVSALLAIYTPVSADFKANITSGNPPLTVAFTDLSTGSPLPSSWSWNFGEGQGGSTSQNPTHTYATWGTYTVSLTVTNPYSSDTMTKTAYISVRIYVEPFPGYTNPPTDPDGDGLFEDINGNGMLDFDDVVAFYQNMAWVTANTAVGIDPYDFNGNGRIDYDDVVLLYYEVLAG